MKLRDRLRIRVRFNEHVRDLERKLGIIAFLGAALVGTIAILISKGCE